MAHLVGQVSVPAPTRRRHPTRASPRTAVHRCLPLICGGGIPADGEQPTTNAAPPPRANSTHLSRRGGCTAETQ